MKRWKKIVLICISVVAMALCVCCCLYIYQFVRGNQLRKEISQMAVSAPPVITVPETPVEESPEEAPEEIETEVTEVVEPEEATIVLGIDFDQLAAINEEIYAWIEIPGTTVSYPILQSQTDDLFYNSHNIDKSYFSGGSVYTQRYNTMTFDDTMTLVYGHNFHDQSLFAPLTNFTDVNFFRENRYIYVYTRDTAYQYEIFAAYPHTTEHLLLCYDFNDETQFNAYFDDLSDSVMNANYDREKFPAFGDKVLTLSTCYRYSRGQRYLVQGVLTGTYQVVQEAAE